MYLFKYIKAISLHIYKIPFLHALQLFLPIEIIIFFYPGGYFLKPTFGKLNKSHPILKFNNLFQKHYIFNY